MTRGVRWPARVSGAVAGLVSAVVVVGGCGVQPQQRPEPVPSVPVGTAPPAPEEPGAVRTTVWMVRGERLQGVPRSVASLDLPSVLASLAAGPTRSEVVAGVRTAVVPQFFSGVRSEVSDRVAVVGATEQFAGLAGDDQLLAVAQLVWTVTEVPGVRRVRLEIDGRAVDVPTDRGLTGLPVGRADVSSVGPRRSG